MKFNQGQFKWAQQICPQVLNFLWVVGLVNACVKKIKLVTHMFFFKPKLFKLTVLCSINVMKFNQGQFKWAQQICPQVLNFLWVVGLVNACVKKIKLVTHMFF